MSFKEPTKRVAAGPLRDQKGQSFQQRLMDGFDTVRQICWNITHPKKAFQNWLYGKFNIP